MTRRYTTTLMINEENEATVSFEVAWGSPESGRFGPPEDYDPGADSVVESIRVEKVDTCEIDAVSAKSYADDIENDADMLDELLQHAIEFEEGEAERFAELAWADRIGAG